MRPESSAPESSDEHSESVSIIQLYFEETRFAESKFVIEAARE